MPVAEDISNILLYYYTKHQKEVLFILKGLMTDKQWRIIERTKPQVLTVMKKEN